MHEILHVEYCINRKLIVPDKPSPDWLYNVLKNLNIKRSDFSIEAGFESRELEGFLNRARPITHMDWEIIKETVRRFCTGELKKVVEV